MDMSGNIESEPLDEVTSVCVASGERPLTEVERRCFDRLYREQSAALARTLRARLPNEEDVAEVMQEAFLRLLRYRGLAADSLKYLLFRVALNLAVNHQRRAGVHSVVSLDDAVLVSDELPVEQRLMHEQAVTRLAMAIDALPPKCRQIYVMNRLRGVRQHEIARRCGVSTRMVEMHIARAQALLREQIGKLAA